ncbi:reverse transcriptase family protein, partial [Singulisphaera rosea]
MTLHAGRDWLEFPPLSITYTNSVAFCLAEAFVGGSWEVDELVDRGASALGRRWRWLRPLARRINAEFGQKTRLPANRVAAFLLNDPGFRRACQRESIDSRQLKWLPPRMFPAPGTPSSWDIP